MKSDKEVNILDGILYAGSLDIGFGRGFASVMPRYESLCYKNILRLISFVVFMLMPIFSKAECVDSEVASIPCVDTSFRAVFPLSSNGSVQTGVHNGPCNLILRVVNIPSNSATNDWEAALSHGLYGYGNDRLALNRTFTPTMYARHLNMLKELFGRLVRGKWSVVDKQFSDTNLVFSVLKKDGKSRIFWCERHFLCQGSARCIFYAKRYCKGDNFNAHAIAKRQSELLADWEKKIRETSKITVPTSNALDTNIALDAKSRRKVGQQGILASENEKPFGVRSTTSERVKSATAALNWLQQSKIEGQKEFKRKNKVRSDEKFTRCVTFVSVLLAWIICYVYFKKISLNERTQKGSSEMISDVQYVKCHFCGRSVPIENGIEVSLTRNKYGMTSCSCLSTSVRIPCCNACANSICRENKKTFICRLATVLIVYVICVVVIAVISNRDFWEAVFLGCLFSYFPALFSVIVLLGLKPMPFAPKWHNKVIRIPLIAKLIQNGFRLRVRVKHKMSLMNEQSSEAKHSSDLNEEGDKLAFLDAGKDGILRVMLWKTHQKVIVDSIMCRLYLPKEWNADVDVEMKSPHNFIARVAGLGDHEWLSVEYLHLSPEHIYDDLGDWVYIAKFLTGRLLLCPHLSKAKSVDKHTEVAFGRLDRRDVLFMKYHNADDMAAFVGVIEIEGRLYRLFIVIVRRGADSWKFEYVFPAAEGVSRASQELHPEEISAAMRIFVPIETIGKICCSFCGEKMDDPSGETDESCVYVWMKDFFMFDDVRMAKGGLGIPCCAECREKICISGVEKTRLEKIQTVHDQIAKGASIIGVKCGTDIVPLF